MSVRGRTEPTLLQTSRTCWFCFGSLLRSSSTHSQNSRSCSSVSAFLRSSTSTAAAVLRHE